MAINLSKQPSETRIFGMSFKNKLRSTSETLVSLDSISVYPDDASLTVTNHSLGVDIANIQVSSGTNGRTYKITVIVTTSDGQILENEGLLDVKDI